MASGTITLTRTGSGYLAGQILWSSKSNGTEANTSTVTAQLQIQRSALNTTTGTFKGTFKVGSTSETISWYGSLPSMEWVTIKTITFAVSHNADGKGSCYLYAIVNGPTGTTMEGTYVSGASTVTLDRIPRFASVVSATDFTDEGNPVIRYANPAGTAVSSLQVCISLTGSNADVPYRDISKTGTKYTFSLTEAERNTLRAATPNSNTLKVYIYVRSTIGESTQTDGISCRMTVVNANPTVSPTVVDTNSATTALTGDSSILVALHSKAEVTINAAAQKYAAIKSKKITHGNATLTGDGTLSVTNHPIKISATDSRGNTVTKTAGNTVVAYINPTCSIGDHKPEADGSFALEVTGLFYNGKIGATANALKVQYRYKAAGGSYGSWTAFSSVAKDGNRYTAAASLSGFDYQTVYTIQARVIDSLHTSGVKAADKSVIAEPVFHWGENDFQFNVPVNLKPGCDILKSGSLAYVPTSRKINGKALSANITLSASDIGAASENSVGTNKVFNKLTDIGITTFPTTMQTVANSMPNNSTLMLDSRDIVAGGKHEISDLGVGIAGMYLFMRGNSNARLSMLNIYSSSSATVSHINYGCYAVTTNKVTWIYGERQNSTYPDCRYRIAADGNNEWMNPPMLLGTEYRTAERYNGKVVYAKLVNFGTLPNNTKKQVDYYSSGASAPVSLTAMLSTGNVLSAGKGMDRYITAVSNVWLDCSKKYIRIVTDGDYSSVSANVLVKYTKD